MTEFIIRNLLADDLKASGFTSKFYQTVKQCFISVLKICQKIEAKGHFLTHSIRSVSPFTKAI